MELNVSSFKGDIFWPSRRTLNEMLHSCDLTLKGIQHRDSCFYAAELLTGSVHFIPFSLQPQFVKFANIEEDTPSYHRSYDFFVSRFSEMCHSSYEDPDIRTK